ncbi:MAG: MFS transporter [Sporichthyaceae bacterium]|nr:MFS transporter [Sporichthyaceae bacterium]
MGVLPALRNRDYRLYLSGHLISVIGTWMQRVAQDWLVLELTGSPLAVGIAAGLQFAPILGLGLWGGAVVDRVDRRRILIGTQAVSGLLATALAVVTVTGVVTVIWVYAHALGLGLVTVIDSTARQVLVGDVVPREHYVAAYALSSVVANIGRLLGPAIGGGLIAIVGVGAVFWVNAASFLPVIVGLLLIGRPVNTAVSGPERSRHAVRDGLHYLRTRRDLQAVVLLVAAVSVFGQNFRVVFPVLARDTFGGDASTYGYLTSALGLGALAGGFAIATRSAVRPKLVALVAIGFGLTNLVVAVAPSLAAAIAAIALLGVTNVGFNTLSRSYLQLHTAPELRGRVMALYILIFLGGTAIGGVIAGLACEHWGPRWTLGLAALMSAAAALVVLRVREPRNSAADGPSEARTSYSLGL